MPDGMSYAQYVSMVGETDAQIEARAEEAAAREEWECSEEGKAYLAELKARPVVVWNADDPAF